MAMAFLKSRANSTEMSTCSALQVLSEARTIRSTGAQAPVLILGPALPEERQPIVDEAFIPTVSTVEEAAGYAKCVPAGERMPVHFVIDTGMGRIGSSEEEASQIYCAICAMSQLQMTALSSHLPVADEDENYTARQLERFRAIAARLLPENQPAAILNSAGVMRFGTGTMHGDLVRVGLSVYGISPLRDFQGRFRPAMTLKTRVVLVRSLGAGRSISYGRTFVTPWSNESGNALRGIRRRYRPPFVWSGNGCVDQGASVPVTRQSDDGPGHGRRDPP